MNESNINPLDLIGKRCSHELTMLNEENDMEVIDIEHGTIINAEFDDGVIDCIIEVAPGENFRYYLSSLTLLD